MTTLINSVATNPTTDSNTTSNSQLFAKAGSIQRNKELAKVYSAQTQNTRYRKNYIAWESVERANKPKNTQLTAKTKYLSKNSQALLAVIMQKLRHKDRLFLNHAYISKITKCQRRHNQNIIKELSLILNIHYHNAIFDDGKKYRYCYGFSLIKLDQDSLHCSRNLNNSTEQKISQHTIYKENNIINNRSIESNVKKF